MSVSKSTATPKKPLAVSKVVADKKPAAKKATAKTAVKAAPAKAAPAKAASPKPGTVKATAPKTKAVKATAVKATPAKSKAAKSNGATPITPEQRYRMICDAAYFRAERRGFIGGNPAEDWTAAEAEIDRLLLSIKQ